MDGGFSSTEQAGGGLTDAELVALALNGVERAFGWLFERHSRHLRRLVARRLRNRDDAHDVLQETRIAVWGSLQRYDRHRPFEAWLTTIAVNKCRDWARHRRVRVGMIMQMRSQTAEAETFAAEPSTESLVIDKERLQDLGRALDELTPALRAPLILTTLEELPQSTVAHALGLTRKAVEMRVRRARRDLACLMSACG